MMRCAATRPEIFADVACCGKFAAPDGGAVYGLIRVERSAKNADGEVREVRRVVVKLDPADDAVVFQVLRDLGFADAEMFGELGLQAAARFEIRATRAALRLRALAAAAANEIAEADAERLAG